MTHINSYPKMCVFFCTVGVFRVIVHETSLTESVDCCTFLRELYGSEKSLFFFFFQTEKKPYLLIFSLLSWGWLSLLVSSSSL